MMRSIVGSSLNLRFFVVVVAILAMLAGAAQLRQMPVDILPEFSVPYVEIQTEALGLSADEVEQLITTPMEQDLLNGVPWLETVHSNSVAGLSDIVLIFDPGTDVIRARQMVGERLAQAFALPHVSKPPTMIQPLSSTGRFMIIGLSSKELSMIEMSVLARWTIGPRLMGVPGVANVSIWGNRDRQLQVQVDPAKLSANGISLEKILETTGNALWVSSLSFLEASTPGTGGFIDTPQQRLGIWHISPIVSAEDLSRVPIEGAEQLRLGEVATVVEDHQPLIGDAIVDNGNGLLLVVEKFPGANTLEVTQALEDTLDAMRPGLSGIEMDSSNFRPANFIESSMTNMGMALGIGLLLLALFVGLSSGWRAALISAITILLSLIAAGWVLYARGATMNVIVLAGLLAALGVVIDDAIIDVSTILQRLGQNREHGNANSTLSIILEASLESRNAMTYAILIVILSVSPIFFLAGQSASFFQSLGFSYILAVITSMVVALVVTPALSLILLENTVKGVRSSSFMERQKDAYQRTLARVVQYARPMMLAVLALVVIGFAVFPLLNRSLIPAFKDRNLLIQLTGAPGMSQTEMSRIDARMSNELQSIPGILKANAHMGRAVRGDQVVGVNSSELWLTIDPKVNYDKTVAAIQRVVKGYPGLNSEVVTYFQDRTDGLVEAGENSLNVRIYGDRLDILTQQTEEIKKALTGIKGITDLSVDLPLLEPTLKIQVDIAKAREYGIKPGDVRRTAAILLSGIQVGNLFEDQKVFDVVVWGTPETRSSISSVREMLIDTPSGEQVRLGDIADVIVAPVPTLIQHESVKRYLDIAVTVEGRDFAAVSAEIKGRLQKMQFPLEYHAQVVNGFAVQQSSSTRTFTFAVAAVLVIFLLLQSVYRSWRLALLSFIMLPFALLGGMVAVFATGGVLSLGSIIGFLLLFGLAVRHSILMTNHFYHVEENEGVAFGPELITRGASERFGPIMMTALGLALVLVPSLIMGDVPGLEIIRPMAIVVIGGLVTTTLINLFVLPTLYLRYGASREQDLELAPTSVVDLPATATD